MSFPWWGDFDEDEDDGTATEAPPLEVDVSLPTIVAELFHPDGSVLATFTDRPAVPFGYQPGEA